MFVLVVSLRIKPGKDRQFLTAIEANATASLREEPGCRRFDVLAPTEASDKIFLYEIYDDRAAFDAHLKSPHFAAFNRESEALVISKTVAQYNLACEGSQRP